MERHIFLPLSCLFSSWFFIVFDLRLWFISVKLLFPVLLLYSGLAEKDLGRKPKGHLG